MKALVILYLIVLFNIGDDLHKTAKVNKLKTLAEKAYKQKNYKEALVNYNLLIDSMKITNETILLNKAHCLYNLKDMKKAQESYSKLSHATDKTIQSIANQQLGNIAFGDKNLDMAKNYYKSSLKAHPGNENARYNYELVSKLLKKEENKDDKKQDKKDDSPPPQEPSLFAKKLKEKAEALAAVYKYDQAYNLMNDGMKKDKSVSYFQDFIEKLKVVADLSEI